MRVPRTESGVPHELGLLGEFGRRSLLRSRPELQQRILSFISDFEGLINGSEGSIYGIFDPSQSSPECPNTKIINAFVADEARKPLIKPCGG